MQNKIITFMKQHHLMKKNSTVLVGVSGGPYFMALLHFLCSIRQEWHLELVDLSIEHQLRGEEAKEDLDYVQKKCEQWGVKFVGTSLNVPAYMQERQIGTQVAARELRYQFFEKQMDLFKADYLALGHHGDDQIETLLMRLVRSATSSAFSGIPVKRNFASGLIVRPFLCVTKAAIEAYCDHNKIIPQIDPTNYETNYTRNYFRKYVLPLLKTQNNNIHTTIQQLSESLQEDETFLQDAATNMFNHVCEWTEDGEGISFEIDLFKSYPHALQRRAYHLILNYLYDKKPGNLSYVHESHFFALLENEKGNSQIDFPSNLKLEKSYHKLIIYFKDQESQTSSIEKTINLPGKVNLQNGSKIIASYTNILPEKQDENIYICAADRINLPLHMRTRRGGDRMSWKGLKGSKKVKDIFIDAKIPRIKREKWPLITDNKGEILWLVGLKKGEPKLKTEEGSSYIQLNYQKGNM